MSKEQPATLDSSYAQHEDAGLSIAFKTHLKDTITLKGCFILFLRPDSLRFASYDEGSGIYEVDSDFAVGIANTMDSLAMNNTYKYIKAFTSAKRYIQIEDCEGCPIIIDRDTVNYGVILSAAGRKPETRYNDVHSGNYLQVIEDYFGIN